MPENRKPVQALVLVIISNKRQDKGKIRKKAENDLVNLKHHFTDKLVRFHVEPLNEVLLHETDAQKSLVENLIFCAVRNTIKTSNKHTMVTLMAPFWCFNVHFEQISHISLKERDCFQISLLIFSEFKRTD